MNDPLHDNLESRLEALSRPPAEPTALWRAALEEHRSKPAKRSVIARIGPWVGLAAAVIVVGVMLLPAVGKARRTTAFSSLPPAARERTEVVDAIGSILSADQFGNKIVTRNSPSQFMADSAAATEKRGPRSPRLGSLTLSESAAASPRLVARRADLSLRVPDVREAFLRAQRTTSPALGEFVEDSKITGEGPAATADLTLRIAAPRLPAALDELRTLGMVASETSSGDDVTDQAIDLDARLRNERRVETEILQLLDTRKDAPLADVMKLRDSLTAIRSSIERMDAQRANLSRMVELATVLVILRPAEAAPPPPPPEKGFLMELKEQSGAAWREGSHRLAASVARGIELLIGSALTIVLLLLAAPIGIGLTRRLIRFAAAEPQPRFR